MTAHTIREAVEAPTDDLPLFRFPCAAGHVYVAAGRPDPDVFAEWHRAHDGHVPVLADRGGGNGAARGQRVTNGGVCA